MMNKAAALGVLRHLLTAGGGYLVASGWLDATQVEALVGAGLAIAGVVWSVLDKRK